MSDLQGALTEGLGRLDEVARRVADTRSRATGARALLEESGHRLETRAGALPGRTSAAIARLHDGGSRAETACAEAARELDGAGALVKEQGTALGAELGRALRDLDELRGELARMHADLREREERAAAALEDSARRTREALQSVADGLSGFEAWTRGELTPSLAQQRRALDESREDLRRHVADVALPALEASYAETRDHLAALAEELRQELQAGQRLAGEAATSALQSLGECVDGLLARNLQVVAAVRAHFGAERDAIRGRADEFARDAEGHARLGDPAARGLKGLVDLVLALQELLRKAGILDGLPATASPNPAP